MCEQNNYHQRGETIEDPDQIQTTKGDAYKSYGIVTNRSVEGNELIRWYRERIMCLSRGGSPLVVAT